MDSNSMERIESQNQIPQSEDPSKGTSFFRTCLNGVNALSGVGILSVPYALSEGGWLSLIILLLVAILCCYTGLLLQKCMSASQTINTYADIGQFAFGKKGKIIISTFMYLELYLVAVEFLMLEGDNLQKLFPNANIHVGDLKIGGKETFVMLAALIILPTTWLRSLGLLAYVSLGGVLASILLVCVVFWVGAVDGVGFQEKGILWKWSGLATAVSMFTFCYCGHAVFPTLGNSMKDKSQFPKVLLLCFILSTITYGSMAIIGYLMYGQKLLSQVTLNLPTGKVSSKIAIYTATINPITKYALIVSPIITVLVIRTVLVISTVIVALVVPFFEYVMTFIGAFTGISLSILFPCICYLKIRKPYSRSVGIEVIFIGVIIVLGSFVAIYGTYVSLKNIISHVQQK
ncbi:PREDICTED: vacuolar amino acid transporter 1-like [Nicotiana attenuata]|uniref:Amino acid transporter ant1 n=1 Tax=Nicotiana attenuata TaxID=49451 RepID=A0A1J6K6Z6_NICAT|nr:PREDICTED: vacuolar amino acid transporter 1-like [Nicotiana attenuata]OIT25882.1 amino acid transporter ant1 [Nicotiana attenuata]